MVYCTSIPFFKRRCLTKQKKPKATTMPAEGDGSKYEASVRKYNLLDDTYNLLVHICCVQARFGMGEASAALTLKVEKDGDPVWRIFNNVNKLEEKVMAVQAFNDLPPPFVAGKLMYLQKQERK